MRFEREARAAAALNHPNLLTVHDVGLDEGTPYLVTELLEGETLRQVLREGACSPASAVTWALGIGRGLAAAHAKGVVHRDLKPDNVFLTADGGLKILDFGLAKILAQETEDATQAETVTDDTEAGRVLGTMGYMAPEQLRGEPVDVRTDVFAFGCVLYEMLSNRRPFGGATGAETAAAILKEDPSALPDTGPLGLHGSRLYRHPVVQAVVEAQLQALGPLSRRFSVGLLVPNVDSVEQFQHWRASINAALSNPGVSVGAMLESAGAALAVDGFLATADLVGFGLNDLMQSLFGADRDLPAVRAHLDPYAPALYRFLRLTAELAGPGVNRVQLCGILPQLPGVLPVLLGLGYRTFSVDVAHAPYLARTVATRSAAQDRGLAEAVCAAASSHAVADLLGVWHETKR